MLKTRQLLVNLPRGGHSSSSNGNRFARLLPSNTTLCTAGFLLGVPSSTSSNLYKNKNEKREENRFIDANKSIQRRNGNK